MSNDDQLILTVLSRLNESQARLYVAKGGDLQGTRRDSENARANWTISTDYCQRDVGVETTGTS
jgi:hypothetical protein